MSPRLVGASALLAVAFATVIGGCTGSQRPTSPSTQALRVRISGSGTCMPLLRILTRDYPDTSINFVYLPGLHSKGGIQGVGQGDLEIGTVSRDMTDAEKTLGLRHTALSNDGLVMAVHPGVASGATRSVQNLTTQQVRDVYTGKITNWSELGGPDMPIVVLDRNEDESAKIILRKYVLDAPGSPLKLTPKAVKLYYEPDMVEALTTTPGSIGYFSLGYGLSESIPVKILSLDGVMPSVSTIESGKYKVIRPLGVVTANKTDPKIREFLDWATGPKAAAIMRQKGYAPVNR